MKRIYFLILFAFTSAMVIAQDGGGATNVDVNLKTDGGAAGFPWLWVVGGIVFILLLVALMSGGRGRDRVVHKKTIVKE